MVGAFASVIAIYRIALPFMENRNSLDIAVIAAIIFIVIGYILAVVGGIPPKPPKTIDQFTGAIPTSPTDTPLKAVAGGIPPAPPKKDNP